MYSIKPVNFFPDDLRIMFDKLHHLQRVRCCSTLVLSVNTDGIHNSIRPRCR